MDDDVALRVVRRGIAVDDRQVLTVEVADEAGGRAVPQRDR